MHGIKAMGDKNQLQMCFNVQTEDKSLVYSRTSLTRGFWEEKNRSKKPRVVEVPRVREGS